MILFFVACLLMGFLATFLFFRYHRQPNLQSKKPSQVSVHWGVSSANPLATLAGMEILKRGGNAMDAAVAIAYTLSVVEPYACGLGGGGEMLIYRHQDKKTRVIDYRETTPLLCNERPNKRMIVGIPGFTAGMEYIRQKYGTLPRSVLMDRAIKYAQKGFAINQTLASLLSQYNGTKITPLKTPAFFDKGLPLPKGTVLRQISLGRQLQKISQQGSPAFYNRQVIQDLNNAVDTANQFLPEDLEKYQVRDVAPVSGRFYDCNVVAPPPPGGGMSFIEMLQLAEMSQATRPLPSNEERFLLLFKGMAITYADRRSYLGDPFFGAKIPAWINQPNYLRKRWDSFDNRFNIPENDEEQSTTHFVVVDAQDNWVSCTQTLGDFFGSGMMQNGYFLNNALNKFSSEAGSPNRMVPGKRPFSYMSPALLFKAGRPFLGLGSPGGRRIPAILTQMLIYHLRDGVSLTEAVHMPRFFLNPRRNLYFEKPPSANILANLQKRGFHPVHNASPLFYGAIQALEIDPETGRLIGAADFRREGSFACRNLNQGAEQPKQ